MNFELMSTDFFLIINILNKLLKSKLFLLSDKDIIKNIKKNLAN